MVVSVEVIVRIIIINITILTNFKSFLRKIKIILVKTVHISQTGTHFCNSKILKN